MQNTDSERDQENAQNEIDLDPTEPYHRHRRADRRSEGIALFGGYQGPERRSGRDRRASA